MSLYLLNLGESQEKKNKVVSHKYQTQVTGHNYFAICVKALDEILKSLKEGMLICDKMNELKTKTENEEELLQCKSEFQKLLSRAKEITKAFIEECQSVRDEKEIIEYIEFLRNRFDILLTKIHFFYLLQNVQHGFAAIELTKLLLNIFKNCLEGNFGTNSDLVKIKNRSNYDKFLKSDQETKDFGIEDKIE